MKRRPICFHCRVLPVWTIWFYGICAYGTARNRRVSRFGHAESWRTVWPHVTNAYPRVGYTSVSDPKSYSNFARHRVSQCLCHVRICSRSCRSLKRGPVYDVFGIKIHGHIQGGRVEHTSSIEYKSPKPNGTDRPGVHFYARCEI